jgi:hypothetical protein
MRQNHMTFGIDRRGSAVVACNMSQWPHLERPTGTPIHILLDMLAEKGREYTTRALGNITLDGLGCYHPDTMQPYVFAPITPTPLFDPSSNVAQLVPHPGVILPIHVALGLTDDGRSLEFSESDDAHRALPGTVRTTPLHELSARGPDGAATHVGRQIMASLMRLYPAVFAPYPQLAQAE